MNKHKLSILYLTNIILLLILSSTIHAQNFVYVDDNVPNAKETIRISDDITFPNIQVILGRNISFEDFSVGITTYKNQAHYIITKNPNDAERLVQVNNCDNFPDLSILVKEEIAFPDIRIEFRDNFADILIYTEKTTISEQELIACLLPLIREKTGK